MADSASIGAGNSSRYQGSSQLGGGSFGSFQLDTKPVEDLARYLMLYNRAEYDQRQKDAETAAREIADYTSYDLTTGIPKDAKLLQEKYDKLTNYVRDNPNALDYRNKKEWAEYKKMRNDLDNDLEMAKVRHTMWALRQKEIQNTPNQQMKDLLQKELDDEIAATDIRTPLKHTQVYQDKPFEIPAPKDISFDVTKVGPNGVVIREYKVFNVPAADSGAAMFAIGLKPDADPSTPQGQRDIIANQNNPLLKGAEAINSVINLQDASGNYVYKTKVTDAAGNVTWVLDESKLSSLPKNVLGLIKDYNKYVTDLKADVKSGVLLDKFEKPITFGTGALNEDDYTEINFNDGITPEELGKAAIYAQWKGDNYSTKFQQTDNAIQRAQLAETTRHNKATEGIAWGNLKLEQDKWNAGTKGGETVKNGAMEFAKRLYSDLEKLADKNGVISPENMRKLNVEQLKYLGVEVAEQRDDSGKIIKSGGFTPLSPGQGSAIQLDNGKINFLKPAEGETTVTKTSDGRYVGLFDPERSTNVFNIATNRVNEELKNSGSKELNTYMPIDLGTGGVSTNVVGGGTQVSGSSTDKMSKWDKYLQK